MKSFFCTLFLHTRVKIIPTHTAVADGTVRGERGEQAAGATACERRVWERETKLKLSKQSTVSSVAGVPDLLKVLKNKFAGRF